MELINLKDFKRKEDIYQSWNDEYGNIYPIRLF